MKVGSKMKVAIVNCFHWVGYHLVEEMLEEGVEVIGIHESNTKQSEFLSMFVHRNSLFTETDMIPENVDYTVVIGHTAIDSTRLFTIQLIEENIKTSDMSLHDVTIEIPLLYGEWMPMDEKGIFVQNKYISFTSNIFMEKGVYVQDYIKDFLDVIHAKIASSSDEKSVIVEELILENDSYFRDNSTKRKIIEQLQKEYRRNRLYYEE